MKPDRPITRFDLYWLVWVILLFTGNFLGFGIWTILLIYNRQNHTNRVK